MPYALNPLTMELVEGQSPKGPLPFDDAWKIAMQIAAALECAHEKGIVHRDLKQANIKGHAGRRQLTEPAGGYVAPGGETLGPKSLHFHPSFTKLQQCNQRIAPGGT